MRQSMVSAATASALALTLGLSAPALADNHEAGTVPAEGEMLPAEQEIGTEEGDKRYMRHETAARAWGEKIVNADEYKANQDTWMHPEQVMAKLREQGYEYIFDFDIEDDEYEVEALGPDGDDLELTIDPQTAEVLEVEDNQL